MLRYRHWQPAESNAFAPGNDGVTDVRMAISSDGEAFEWVSGETLVDRGVGHPPQHRTASGRLTLKAFPLNLFRSLPASSFYLAHVV